MTKSRKGGAAAPAAGAQLELTPAAGRARGGEGAGAAKSPPAVRRLLSDSALADIIGAHDRLTAALARLAVLIERDEGPACAYRPPFEALRPGGADDAEPEAGARIPVATEARPRAAIAAFVKVIAYQDGQHPKSSARLPGACAASPETLAFASEVNALKDAFGALLRNKPESFMDELRAIPAFNRLHVRQATRKIPLLLETPTRLAFTWIGGTFSSTAMPAGELIERIRTTDLDGRRNVFFEHQAADIRRLEQLPSTEWVALRQAKAPYPCVNAWTAGSAAPRQIRASMPLLYLQGAAEPQVRPLSDYEPPRETTRSSRADAIYEDKPFLQFRQVFRRKEQYRAFGDYSPWNVGMRRTGGMVELSLPDTPVLKVLARPEEVAAALSAALSIDGEEEQGSPVPSVRLSLIGAGEISLRRWSRRYLLIEARVHSRRIQGRWERAAAQHLLLSLTPPAAVTSP